MSETDPGSSTPGARERAARRRRLAEVFGDVLPDQTSDDAEADADQGRRTREEWLRGEVPPHHTEKD